MAEEEFQESELLRPEPYQGHCISTNAPFYHHCPKTMPASRKGLSTPIEIPQKNVLSRSWSPGFDYQIYGDDGGELSEEEEMVLPHVVAVRRESKKIAFSVCTGNGRTLKGRDLRRVRNSVLQMTGFIES